MAKFKQKQAEEAYRIYLTDALHALSNGCTIEIRYCDWIKKSKQPRDTRTSAEIIADMREILKKAGE